MMVMLLLKKHHRKRSKRIWQKKENVSNVFIVKETGVPIGVGTVRAKERM